MLVVVVFILEIVDCNPDRLENAGDVVAIVTAKPALLACIAGELDLVVAIIDGDALLKLVTDGEFLGPGELMVIEDGELWRLLLVVITTDGDGDARIAGELTRLGRQCLTESEPDWESLLLLGEPGEDTITWRGLSPPATDGPTRGESGR